MQVKNLKHWFKCRQQFKNSRIYEKGGVAVLTWIMDVGGNPNIDRNICTKFHPNPFFGSREDVFKRLTNQKFQSPVAAMFMTNQHQRNNTCARTHREHYCQFGFLFCIFQEEVWSMKHTYWRQTSSDGKSSHWPFARWVKMKTTMANFLGQIISNYIRVRIFIFTRFGGQNIYKESW